MRFLLRSLLLLALVALSVPAFGAIEARPGTVNYVEGNVSLAHAPLNPSQVGTAVLNPGSVLATRQGKAEILLTPGVYLRVGSQSAVRMISPDLTRTQVELLRGRASVEVDQIHPENNLQVLDGGVTTRLLKTGYYEFDANPAMARVYTGQASVEEIPGQPVTLKGHHQIRLAPGVAARSNGFNVQHAQNDLYNWSRLRSQYLAQAGQQMAREYGGPYGYYPNWVWDPYAWDYAYLGPGPFWSPFGWGYYPPFWGGFYGGYYVFHGAPHYHFAPNVGLRGGGFHR